MWREAFASERRLIPDVPVGVCGGPSVAVDLGNEQPEGGDVDFLTAVRELREELRREGIIVNAEEWLRELEADRGSDERVLAVDLFGNPVECPDCGGAWLLDGETVCPWCVETFDARQRLIATLTARAGMVDERDEATGERARGPREEYTRSA